MDERDNELRDALIAYLEDPEKTKGGAATNFGALCELALGAASISFQHDPSTYTWSFPLMFLEELILAAKRQNIDIDSTDDTPV